jgi:hypothetical protein
VNPEKTPELSVQALMMLRTESDAVRVITERLKVEKMGPADHIRTKHEVKAFIASGDEAEANAIIARAAERRTVGQRLAQKIEQTRGQRI